MPRIITTLGIFALPLVGLLAQADESTAVIAATQSAAQHFDYHAVRGRKPLNSSSGRYEGELHLEMAGRSRAQAMKQYGDQWSGDVHLLWDGVVGDSMETSFDVPTAGVYDIAIQLTVAVDYGLFDISLNDEPVKRGIDLFGPRVALAPLLTVQDVPLQSGRQSLVFQLVGSNPQAQKFRGTGYLMGLDYLQLEQKAIPQNNDASDPPSRTRENSDVASDNSEVSRLRLRDGSNTAAQLTFDELTSTLARFCYQCHSGDTVEGEIDLGRLTAREKLLADIQTTRRVRDVLYRHEMPPEDEEQPSKHVRAKLVATLDDIVDEYLKDHRSTAPIVMRRLNRFEYNNAVRDLLQLKGDIYPLPEKTIRADQQYFNPASGRFPDAVRVGNRTLGKNQVEKQILTGVSPFAIDLQAEGGFNNRGRELSISPILLESFLKLGRSIVSSPEFDGYCGITNTFFTAPATATPEQHQQLARERLAPFLERAFRGEVVEQLLDRYHRFFVRRLRETTSFRQSMNDVVAAVLASPKFIYIAESAADDARDELLSAYELATRLSFFLWSSIPDEELLRAARDGSLMRPDVLDAQVTRMLEDPRCQSLSRSFARQWLRLDQLVTAVPDFDRFPQYYARIGCEQWKFGLQTMVEPLLLFESIMVEDRSIMLLVDSNYAYRSDELQSWYEDEVPFAKRENRDRFNTNQQVYRRRTLKDRRQGGVITSAATLTMTSAPLRTSPILRGAWVATVIFNQPPPPPPDTVPPIEADDKAIEAKGLTLRQRLIQHQVNQSCASCHAKIDPLGFALENYDAVGRWRDSYTSGLAIDASGELFGKAPFADVIGLKDAILEHPHWFMRAFCEHMLSYSLGRELKLSDAPAVDDIVAQVAADRGQFTTVVRSIVHSHPFRYRSLGPAE